MDPRYAGTRSTGPLDRAIGASIRLRRRMRGLSQEELAEACDVSFQQVQKYENGTNRVAASRLVLIARALRTRVSELLGDLDEAEGANSEELQILHRAYLDGAPELLEAYETLDPEVRRSLVGLVQLIAQGQAQERVARRA